MESRSHRRKIKRAAGAIIPYLGPAACFLLMCVAAPPSPAVEKKPLAVVNGTSITQEEFGRDLIHLAGPSALDNMIDRALVKQAARDKGIKVTKKELEKRRKLEFRLRVRRFMRKARIGPSELTEAARQMGLKPKQLAQRLGRNISRDTLRLRLLTEKLLKDRVDVTEKKLQAYYRRTRGKRFLAAHIAVEPKKKARNLLGKLRRGDMKWTKAVRAVSRDRMSVPYKGRVPIIPATSPLGGVLDTMEEGAMKLYRGDRLWHILRLLKIVEPAPESFEQIRDRLRREYISRQVGNMDGRWLAKLRERATVVRNLPGRSGNRAVLGDNVAAYVNGKRITVPELGQRLVERFGSSLVRPYIERRLVLQEARQHNVKVKDSAVQKRLDSLHTLLDTGRGPEGPLDKELQEASQKKRYSAMARNAVRATLLAEKMASDDISVARDKLKKGYQTCTGERYAIRDIVTKSAAPARRLSERLQRGANIGMLLRAKSTRPAPWLNLGIVRHIRKGHPSFEHLSGADRGAFVTFEQDGAYHVAEVLAHKKKQNNQKPSFDQFRQEQEHLKRQERARAWVEKIRAEADIKVNL